MDILTCCGHEYTISHLFYRENKAVCKPQHIKNKHHSAGWMDQAGEVRYRKPREHCTHPEL